MHRMQSEILGNPTQGLKSGGGGGGHWVPKSAADPAVPLPDDAPASPPSPTPAPETVPPPPIEEPQDNPVSPPPQPVEEPGGPQPPAQPPITAVDRDVDRDSGVTIGLQGLPGSRLKHEAAVKDGGGKGMPPARGLQSPKRKERALATSKITRSKISSAKSPSTKRAAVAAKAATSSAAARRHQAKAHSNVIALKTSKEKTMDQLKTKDAVLSDIDSLRADVARMAAQLGQFIDDEKSTLSRFLGKEGKAAKQVLDDRLSDARDKAGVYAGVAKDKATVYAGAAKDQALDLQKSVISHVTANPLQAVAIAGGIGLLYGLWAARSRS